VRPTTGLFAVCGAYVWHGLRQKEIRKEEQPTPSDGRPRSEFDEPKPKVACQLLASRPYLESPKEVDGHPACSTARPRLVGHGDLESTEHERPVANRINVSVTGYKLQHCYRGDVIPTSSHQADHGQRDRPRDEFLYPPVDHLKHLSSPPRHSSKARIIPTTTGPVTMLPHLV